MDEKVIIFNAHGGGYVTVGIFGTHQQEFLGIIRERFPLHPWSKDKEGKLFLFFGTRGWEVMHAFNGLGYKAFYVSGAYVFNFDRGQLVITGESECFMEGR